MLHPGPDGVPVSGTFFGKDTHDRFQEAMRSGRPATFTQDEFDLRFPDAVEEAMGRGVVVEPTDRKVLKIVPSINGRKLHGRLVVEPAAAHSTVESFVKRARRTGAGVAATVTVVEGGTERMLLRVDIDTLPLTFTIEQTGPIPVFRCERPYEGRPVGHALAAERLVQQLNAGAYVGVLAGRAHWAMGTEPRADDDGPLAGLEHLDRLANLADWDILVPPTMSTTDAEAVADLIDLFTRRRRILGRGGTANMVVDTDERLNKLRDRLSGAPTPLISEMQQDAMEITLLGQTFILPPIRRTATIEIPEEAARRIMSATGPPVAIEIRFQGGVDIVEELVLDQESS